MKFSRDVKMLPIWGEKIPGNSAESKLTYMQPDPTMTLMQIFTTPGGIYDKSSDEITNTIADDSLVWKNDVENGYGRETMEDVPFLVPFLVEGSRQAVISCPGGAYLEKSVQGEGEEVAAFLNEAGISCFVLWYRSAPYGAPYMFLDLQRAIRHVRFHAAEYGIDPDQISTVGFSAGGNLNGVTGICFKDRPVTDFVPDYSSVEAWKGLYVNWLRHLLQ